MDVGYSLFVSECEAAQRKFPNLKSTVDDNGNCYLYGEIEILDLIDGKLWETYLIEVRYSEGFPYRFPKVYEKSNKIPKIPDWHVNLDGTCCIKVHPEELLICREGISIERFLEEQALPYFYNQTHRKIEGYYVNGERSHGAEGIAEFYSDELHTNDINTIIRCLNFIATRPRPSRTSSCFCGKKTKFRKCHKGAFEKLRALGDRSLLLHVTMLKTLHSKE
jgi:hypothetical protein